MTDTEHYVRCDACHRMAPGAPTHEKALVFAADAGFRFREHKDLCPSCNRDYEEILLESNPEPPSDSEQIF